MAPFVSSGLSDIVLREGFASRVLNTRLDTIFKDNEGDPLTFSVSSLSGLLIGSDISGNDTLTVTELTSTEIGFDTLVVTAMDMLGGESNDTFIVEIENVAPIVASPIADIVLREGFTTHEVDLSMVFTDRQSLSYTAVSRTGVVTLPSGTFSRDTLSLGESGVGVDTIMVTAMDMLGGEAKDTFLVEVENVPPIVANPIEDITLLEGFTTYEVDLSIPFADRQPLTYTAVGRSGVVTLLPSGSFNRDTLSLGEVGLGVDTIAVTATGMFGGEAKDTFTVTVLPSTYFDSAFVTTWDVSAGDTIHIPIRGSKVTGRFDFWVDWGDRSALQRIIGQDDPDSSHVYTTSDTFKVRIIGSYPHFKLSNASTADKLLSIEQWGNMAWERMNESFSGATNLELNATDTPNLSGVTNMNVMFSSASKLNADLNGWNVSSVTDMGGMFNDATSFNGNMSSWNVSSVTDMDGMFAGAASFDQDIGSWNVSNVRDMNTMFFGATSFNQDIGGWDVSNVSTMRSMFYNATSFNQDIGAWRFSPSLSIMNSMFSGATSFNGDISSWDVSNVRSMGSMFSGATSFNQDIGGWNVSRLDNMNYMFRNATSFNQDIGDWNVARVELMPGMFDGATSFNQDIGGWNVARVRDFTGFLNESGMSTYNYEQLLINWNDSLDLTDNLNFHAVVLNPSAPTDTLGIKYRLRAQPARDSIITNELWTIYDGGLIGNRAPFVSSGLPDIVLKEGFASQVLNTRLDTVFKDDDGDPLTLSVSSLDSSVVGSMIRSNDSLVLNEISTSPDIVFDTIVVTVTDLLGDKVKDTFTVTVLPNTYFDSAFVTTWNVSAGDTIHVPLNGATFSSVYDFWVDWGDGSVPQRIIGGDDPNSSHVYMTSDTFEISITGSYPHFKLANHSQAIKLLSIEEWGNIAWQSMDSAFAGASNLELQATDTPNLSGVGDMSAMFAGASKLNADLSSWNVSSVTNMSSMFSGATSFNGDISSWNVDSVTRMSSMFSDATSFNQNIGVWDVSKVTIMSEVFSGATSFNGDIRGWDVSNARLMLGMFAGATSFNQDIGGWDVSNLGLMTTMFSGATSFNQDIGTWDVSSVRFMSGMFSDATSFNQDLGGWDVSDARLMSRMFSGATSFNQDIGDWDVANVRDFTGFLNESGMSTYNYEQLLINWNASLDLTDNLNFYAVVLNPSDLTDTIGIKYRLRAQPARDSIITNELWTIYDGGLTSNTDSFCIIRLAGYSIKTRLC